MPFAHLRLLLSLVAVPALLLGACAHGDSTGAAPTTVANNVVFSVTDLAGDWVGTMVPENERYAPFPFYTRHGSDGQPLAGADGRGRDWNTRNAVAQAAVNNQGEVMIEVLIGNETMQLSGSLNKAATVLQGRYTMLSGGAPVSAGDFQALLSSGRDYFNGAEILVGTWEGIGYNAQGKSRDMSFTIDALGTLTAGEMVGEHVYIPGGPNTGVFALGDSAVGRLDNVVLQADDGSTLTLHFLLVSEDGELLAGPGVDSELGDGVAELVRQPE